MNIEQKKQETINKIRKLCGQDPKFAAELRKMFEQTSSSSPLVPTVQGTGSISDDVKVIRKTLEIRANVSIDYSFVTDQRTRDQLIIDNLRMENVALDLSLEEKERFYRFCVNAFYQVENIVNYYFYLLYPDFNELYKVIEEKTKKETNGFNFHLNNEKTISDIAISHKLNAACNMLFPTDQMKIKFSNLRQLRNDYEHRCDALSNKKQSKFFQYNTYDTVRSNLNTLILAIKNTLSSLVEKHAIITSILPSACFVSIDGKTVEIPQALLSHVKNKLNGDYVKVVLINDQIVRIK